MRVRDLLQEAGLPRREAQSLLAHVLGVPRTWLIAHDTDAVDGAAQSRYAGLVRRRLAGEPMAYLTGAREFMGHEFLVTPDVLIPRPETELLVEIALAHLQGRTAPRVLDLGTGSGAIALSIAHACPGARVVASDTSAQALAVARQNGLRLDVEVVWRQGDWYAALGATAAHDRFDLIVSNPPYIAADDDHLRQGDLCFEPRIALTDEGDGLAYVRVIVEGAPAHLEPGGALWLEHGWDQAGQVRELLYGGGFTDVRSVCDLAGIERVSGGRMLT